MESVISFLTIIPPSTNNSESKIMDLDYIARKMYLFPVVGFIIGIIMGGLAYGLSFYIQPQLVGLAITFGIIILTGLNHTDALADFADGLMAKGGIELKHKAMADPAIGSAGAIALILYVLAMVIALSSFYDGLKLLNGVIVSEVIAKYIMVFQAYRGTSAWKGFSSPFTSAMKESKRIIAATAITITIVLLVGGYWSLASLGTCLAIANILGYISSKNFGGISGDVLGASNEISRVSSLIVLSALTAF
jgi:adenosylcobinamide-GDP ribazoletransferase